MNKYPAAPKNVIESTMGSSTILTILLPESFRFLEQRTAAADFLRTAIEGHLLTVLQEALHDAVELPNHYTKLWELRSEQVDERVPQEKCKRAIKDRSFVIRENTNEGRDDEVEALHIANIPEVQGKRVEDPEESALALAGLVPEEGLLR